MSPLETFLRENVARYPADLVAKAMAAVNASASEVTRALNCLVDSGEFEEFRIDGVPAWRWRPVLRAEVRPGMEEDRVWRDAVQPRVAGLPDNVQAILYYGTTEMLNNVFDHSGAREVVVVVRTLPAEIEVHVEDDGVGIFNKLQREMRLDDPQHVALELSKGKLTTDPGRHTGQGIFFTARMCDKFLIWSGTTVCGQVDHGEWHVKSGDEHRGTTVRMVVKRDSQLTPKRVFDEYFPLGADDDFAKTRVPVALLGPNGGGFVSRSQAKRLMARCEQFRVVELDFDKVESIGPAFADEVFRVFTRSHPAVELRELHANADVARMIAAARRSAGASPR